MIILKNANQSSSTVLVRAAQNRTINRTNRYAEKNVSKLWDYIISTPIAGEFTLDISGRQKTKHSKGRKARTSQMEVKFGNLIMNPPRNNPKHKTEILPDIPMSAIYTVERNLPEGENSVEWMLLTNQPITSLTEACERVHWYCLRWRIEMYFKALKSGFSVEK